MRSFLFGIVLCGLIAAPAMACGPAAKSGAPVPPFTADLDAHLANARLPEADLAKVRDLRARIETLDAEKKFTEAFKAEDEAMGILGYKRVLSRCTPSTWVKVKAVS